MKILLATTALGMLAGATALSALAAEAQQARIFDRTVTCATGIQGGLRLVTLQASSKAGDRPGSVWALTNVQPTGRVVSLGQSGLELSPFCRVVRTSVPLTARGLTGSVASPFDDRWDCQVPRRVLLRVRVVFERSAPTLRRGDPWGFPILYAHQPVREATLAVRAPAGKAVALARLMPSGKVQLYTSGACFPD